MPSNAQKISQVIAAWSALLEEHGDLDVVFASGGALIALDGRNANVAVEVLNQRLAAPVLVIGLQRNDRGAIRNMPGDVYVASPEAGEWSYDQAAAPDGEPVKIWKRLGGRGEGVRRDGRWYVAEGRGGREVEIVPTGILAWAPL